VLEACAFRDRDRRGEVAAVPVLVGDVLDKQHEQDVVLVLAGIHAAPQLVAALPEGAIQFALLDGHAPCPLALPCGMQRRPRRAGQTRRLSRASRRAITPPCLPCQQSDTHRPTPPPLPRSAARSRARPRTRSYRRLGSADTEYRIPVS